MGEDDKTTSIEEKIRELDALGFVRTRRGHEIRSIFFAISKRESQVAEEGFFALMEKYSVTHKDTLLIREAIAYLYYHSLSEMHGRTDLTNEEIAAKVKWQ